MKTASKIKMSGTVSVNDDPELNRNLALLDEVVTRLKPLMQSQLIVERVQKVLVVLEAHNDLMTGKGVQP